MIPESTALTPASRETVIDTVPPAATSTGRLTHTPELKSVVIGTDRGPEPSSTVIVSRRAWPSQSTAYRCRFPLYAAGKLSRARTCDPYNVLIRREPPSGDSSARGSDEEDAHV